RATVLVCTQQRIAGRVDDAFDVEGVVAVRGRVEQSATTALRSFTTQRSSLVFGSESGPYCEMIPGSCHVTSSCAPSTSIRPSAVLVVCTFQTTCAGCDGSKAAQDDNCDVTSALNSVATPGVG